MRALLAFDKFKDAMSAADACAVAAAALRGAQPEWLLDECPMADGGEGFAQILTTAAGGELRTCEVSGPMTESVAASFGIVAAANVPVGVRASLGVGAQDSIGIVEMAAASGLALLAPDQRNVWRTTSAGTGELLRAAAAAGVNAIVLGVGGSATNDLGLGALDALGLGAEGADGQPAVPTPDNWRHIVRLRGTISGLPPVFIACDVTNPLLGPRGAAAVYGPQKGLRREDVARLDHESARLALMLCDHFGRPDTLMDVPGGGAAGGIAFGFMVALKARLLPGFDFVAQWLDLDARIAAADIVLTGEGRFDETSLSGKGPAAIAARAIAAGKRVAVFAGAIAAPMHAAGLALHAVTPAGTPLDRALREAPQNLDTAVREAFGHDAGAGRPVTPGT